MGPRAWPWFFVVLIAVWLVWSVAAAEDSGPPHQTVANVPEVAAAAPLATDPGQTASPDAERVSIDGGWWVRNLSERAEEPLAAEAEDRFAPAVRGRLTVRQRPWVHSPHVEVRLTRAWLDSVLPTETGADDQLAPAHDDVIARTDADGWFVLRFRPTRGELFLLIDRRGDWMDFQKLAGVPRPGTTLELGDVWLDDRGGIVGTVQDGMGKGLAGVALRAVDDPLLDAGAGLDELRAARNRGLEQFRVPGSLASGPVPDWVVRRDKFLPFPTAITDQNGTFRLHGLRPGAHDLFIVHDAGHASLADVQVACGRDTDIGQVLLRDSTKVRIRFVDDARQPWVGADVAFVHEELGFGTPVLRTNARGEVETFVPAPDKCRIAFGYPGGGPWVQQPFPQWGVLVVNRPQETTITLLDQRGALVQNGRVRFYVVGAAFRPVDRALPSAMQPTEVSPGRHRGRYPCPVVAVAAAPGFAPAMAPLPIPDGTMTMLPIQTITVRTSDRQGTVVAGASVRIQAHDNPELEFPGAQWTLLANDRAYVGRTDKQGLLTVPVWNTWLSLQADHPDFGPSPGPKMLPVPGERIELQLRRPAQLHGRLTFQQRAAAAGFRVRARQKPPLGHPLEGSGWLDEQIAVTGENGAFSFRGLFSGIWELRPELPSVPGVTGAREPGSQWKSQQVLLAEEQELHFTIEGELDPFAQRQIVGTVKMDGVAIAGALVRLREHQQGPTDGERPRRGRSRPMVGESAPSPLLWTNRLTTDTFGDFGFGELKPHTEYELRVDVPWQDRLQFLERAVVRTGPSTRQPVRLDVAVQSGTLRLDCSVQNRVYGNRMLRLRQIGKDGNELARFEMLTSLYGVCMADRLPAGTWVVEPVHGGRCEPAEFTIAPGATVAAALEVLAR